MATQLTDLSSFDPAAVPAAGGMKFGIIVSEFNGNITKVLFEGCYQTLKKAGAKEKDIKVIFVPGAFELPCGAQMLAKSGIYDALICIGCVIKGETRHDEYINHAVAEAIMNLQLMIKKPVVFGVLTPETLQQAQDRAGGKYGNKGIESAVTAIKMVDLFRSLH